jgi:hypothetical protein
MIVDLETVNPTGRVDVIAYRGAQYLTNKAEEHFGLQGVWDALKPHVSKLVNEHITPMALPTELQVLLSIIQANYKGM